MRTDQLKTLQPIGNSPQLMALLKELIASVRENRLRQAPGYKLRSGPNGTTLDIDQKPGGGGSSTVTAVWG